MDKKSNQGIWDYVMAICTAQYWLDTTKLKEKDERKGISKNLIKYRVCELIICVDKKNGWFSARAKRIVC